MVDGVGWGGTCFVGCSSLSVDIGGDGAMDWFFFLTSLFICSCCLVLAREQNCFWFCLCLHLQNRHSGYNKR